MLKKVVKVKKSDWLSKLPKAHLSEFQQQLAKRSSLKIPSAVSYNSPLKRVGSHDHPGDLDFSKPWKVSTQSKPLPLVTEQTTQLHAMNWITTQTNQNKLYSLYKIVLQHVGNTYFLFWTLWITEKKEQQKKCIKIKSKTKSYCLTPRYPAICQWGGNYWKQQPFVCCCRGNG